MDTPAPGFRLLITGSRSWADKQAVSRAIADAIVEYSASHPLIVHGACPTGADQLADVCAREFRIPVERHPADWSQGRSAGPRRNTEMVKLGADICLCFLLPCSSPRCMRITPHDSHGASGCADLAEAIGIPVRRFRSASGKAL